MTIFEDGTKDGTKVNSSHAIVTKSDIFGDTLIPSGETAEMSDATARVASAEERERTMKERLMRIFGRRKEDHIRDDKERLTDNAEKVKNLKVSAAVARGEPMTP